MQSVRRVRTASFRKRKRPAPFDPLTPKLIDDLSGILLHDQRTGMEQRLREGRGAVLGAAWSWLIPQLAKVRVSGDLVLLENILGSTIDALAFAEGVRLDLKGLPVLEAIAKSRQLGLQPLNPNTVNKG